MAPGSYECAAFGDTDLLASETRQAASLQWDSRYID
jgi:hypothetical protein